MTNNSDFYRDIDLVKEAVIPCQGDIVVSSKAKEATAAPTAGPETFSNKLVSLIGDNQLIDGISVRSPAYLSSLFHRLRLNVSETIDKVSQRVDERSSAYYKHERRVTATIADLHSDPREQLLPGFTYIAVAAMSGSVLTRNRNIFYRLTAPLILGSACFAYVLPTTFKNTATLLHDIEMANFPAAVARQDALIKNTKQLGCATVRRVDNASKSIAKSISNVQHFIKEWTGLNVE